jgi:hypothetical protein
MKTYCIREVVHYHVEADSAEEAEETFLNGNITEFPCSIEERDVSEIEQ